jgi:ATP-dependent Clp protease ATP-binding subunit ClpA
MTDKEIIEAAIKHARANKKAIAKKLTNTQNFPPEEQPVSVFMAGSPGAGKTEASKNLLESLNASNVIRLDADELRNYFDLYDGKNSHLFQGAVSILVEKVFDMALKNSQSILLDGTMGAQYEKCKLNIERSIKKERFVQIYYVYQEPLLAWDVVLKRELLEGRRINKDSFIAQYFASRSNIKLLKQHFGSKIQVDALMKDYNGKTNRFYKANISNIDIAIPEKYDMKLLEEIITID